MKLWHHLRALKPERTAVILSLPLNCLVLLRLQRQLPLVGVGPHFSDFQCLALLLFQDLVICAPLAI